MQRRGIRTRASGRVLGLALGAVLAACGGPPEPVPPPAVPPLPASAPAPAVTAAPSEPVKSVETPAARVPATTFGKIDGKDIWLFTLTNANGLKVKITNFGATVVSLEVPDRNGKLADIVLGLDDADAYAKGTSFLGATVGRVANRIRGGQFSLEGHHYALAKNAAPHHLHGGPGGFHKVVWEAKPLETAAGPALELRYVSKDGEEGYPGTLTTTTIYTLTNQNELKVEMSATTDRTTLVNLAHHSYWNLGGYDAGPITGHELTLFADSYTPGDPIVPTGAVKRVLGTPFDFTKAKSIGEDLVKAGGTPIGFDHNFVVNGEPHTLRPVAKLRDPKSGRVMTLEANQPGVQFYSGNFLDGSIHGKGTSYPQYSALCLETQAFPNAINVPAWRDQAILKPGDTYRHVMIHRFSVE